MIFENLALKVTQYSFAVISFLLLLFYFAVMNDPFFGDGISTVSRASFNILESGFTDFTYPDGQDPGHPTLFPALHALLWAIFGKSLAISHLFNFVFAFGILYLIHKWLLRELDRQSALIASLLMLVTPLFMAQTAMINTHLALSFFTLWLAYALYYHYRYQALFAALLLLLCHLQGVFYLSGIMLYWFFVHLNSRQWKFRIQKTLKLLVIPVAVFGLWLAYHYHMKGWLMSAPSTDFYGRGYGGLKISIVNFIVAIWRMIDYGQVAFVIPFVTLFFSKKLRSSISPYLLLFVILFVVNAFMLSFSTTLRSAHRYFLPALPFLVMATVVAWKDYGKKWWMVTVVLVLISGHLWTYPGRTVGDATLAYRNVFPLLEELNDIVDGEDLYTYSPLSDANEYAYLNEGPVSLNSLYDTNIEDVDYVVRGNISGDFSPEEMLMLDTKWNNHTVQKGSIYFTLYINPKLPDPIDNMQKRKVGSFERWFVGKKKQLRGE